MLTKVAFHLSGLAGLISQCLSEAHEFSELVLARMALLADQSCTVLSLRSAKAREFGAVAGKCTRAPWTFPFKLARTSSIWLAGTDKWKATGFCTTKVPENAYNSITGYG